jgi:hypothetical protein
MNNFNNQDFRELYRRQLSQGAGYIVVDASTVQGSNQNSITLGGAGVFTPAITTQNNFASAVVIQVVAPLADEHSKLGAILEFSIPTLTGYSFPQIYLPNYEAIILDINTWETAFFKEGVAAQGGELRYYFIRMYDNWQQGSTGQG